MRVKKMSKISKIRTSQHPTMTSVADIVAMERNYKMSPRFSRVNRRRSSTGGSIYSRHDALEPRRQTMSSIERIVEAPHGVTMSSATILIRKTAAAAAAAAASSSCSNRHHHSVQMLLLRRMRRANVYTLCLKKNKTPNSCP